MNGICATSVVINGYRITNTVWSVHEGLLLL